MSTEYYVFQNEQQAWNCLNYINNTPWFPIVGVTDGIPDPNSIITTCWDISPRPMISGEWAVPRIPKERLDYLNVPLSSRIGFASIFGKDIRQLEIDDFILPSSE